jgi:hypothetical protein
MKYIRTNENKFDWKRQNINDRQLNIQSNIMLDQLIKSRDYINNRIEEVFDYDVNGRIVGMTNPITCNISIFTDENDTDAKSTTIDVSDDEKLEYKRSWGKFLHGVKGEEYEIDFVLIYSLYFPFDYVKSKDPEVGFENSENMADMLVDTVNRYKIFKEDLGDLKITRLLNLRDNDRDSVNLMFELRRKNRIKMDPVRWIKKINT